MLGAYNDFKTKNGTRPDPTRNGSGPRAKEPESGSFVKLQFLDFETKPKQSYWFPPRFVLQLQGMNSMRRNTPLVWEFYVFLSFRWILSSVYLFCFRFLLPDPCLIFLDWSIVCFRVSGRVFIFYQLDSFTLKFRHRLRIFFDVYLYYVVSSWYLRGKNCVCLYDLSHRFW